MGSLVVVRHGQASLFASDYDVLSERGEAQARLLGRHLGEHGPHPMLVFTGPARRQRDTARLCGEAYARADQPWPTPTTIPELDEHDAFAMVRRAVPLLQHDASVAQLAAAAAAGDPGKRSAAFQRLFEAVMERWLRGEIDDPTLESWPSFAERVQRGLSRLLQHDGPGVRMIAFTSVGPLAVMLKRALGTDDLISFQTAWRIRNSSMTSFVFSTRRNATDFTLDAFNALPHLPDASAWSFR